MKYSFCCFGKFSVKATKAVSHSSMMFDALSKQNSQFRGGARGGLGGYSPPSEGESDFSEIFSIYTTLKTIFKSPRRKSQFLRGKIPGATPESVTHFTLDYPFTPNRPYIGIS